MAVTQDPRFGIDVWGAGTDAFPGRVGWDDLLALLTSQAAITSQNVSAAMGAPGIAGRFFWATDTRRLYRDDGAAWTEISPVGGGGVPAQPGVGGEGASRIAARADHQHPVTECETGRTSNQLIPTQIFTPLSLSGDIYKIGTRLASQPSGIRVSDTGRYYCEASYRLPAISVPSRRVIGIGPVFTAAGGGTPRTWPASDTPSIATVTATTYAVEMDICMSQTMSFNAGDVVTVWAYHDAPTTLQTDQCRILLRRVA